MIKLPIVSKGVTLQEIPGEVAVFFEVGNCTRSCRGCHSRHLRTPIFKDLYMSVDEMIHYAEKEKERGATAIVLMGGTTNTGVNFADLLDVIRTLSKVLPVGLYSGADDNSACSNVLRDRSRLTWLKTGMYDKKRGGLSSPTTNQRFYTKQCGVWFDTTYQFQQEE